MYLENNKKTINERMPTAIKKAEDNKKIINERMPSTDSGNYKKIIDENQK